MPIPRIAIVGRPNVGKSSLLNMIAGDKVSIVDPTAGTTRDRVSIISELVPPDEPRDSPRRRAVEVTDTGGFGVYVHDGQRFNEVGADLTRLTDDIEFQISEAVRSADLVLLVIDAQAGVTPQDEEVARLLRERVLGRRGTGALKRRGRHAGPKERAQDASETATEAGVGDAPADRDVVVRVVANKCDGPRWEAHAIEAANLGFGEPIIVSAKTNYLRRDFLDQLFEAVAALPGSEKVHASQVNEPEMKLAIIGKRNAGKSTLVNALAGQKRVIVSEIAGTTRDAVDVRFEMDGHTFLAIDTAGLRKKKSFQDRIEWFAFDRAQRSIERADVVMLLVDATEAVSQVDQQLAMLAQKAYKPVVIVVNKWDLVEGRIAQAGKHRGKAMSPGIYEDYLRDEFKGLEYAPIAFISAEKGTNLRSMVRVSMDIFNQARTRVGTGKLNRVLKTVLSRRGPSSKLGTFAKAYFIAQVAMRPPTVVMVVNKAVLFTPNYKKFLLNRLREQMPFGEVPIKLIIKERSRARPEDLVKGELQALEERGALAIQRAEHTGEASAPDLMVNRHLLRELENATRGGDLGDDASAYFDDDQDDLAAEGAGTLEGDGADGAEPKAAPSRGNEAGVRRGRLAELAKAELEESDDSEDVEALDDDASLAPAMSDDEDGAMDEEGEAATEPARIPRPGKRSSVKSKKPSRTAKSAPAKSPKATTKATTKAAARPASKKTSKSSKTKPAAAKTGSTRGAKARKERS